MAAPQVRWLILDALLNEEGPFPHTLYDSELAQKTAISWDRLREEVKYLAGREYLTFERVERGNRVFSRLRLTPKGIDLVLGVLEDPAICRECPDSRHWEIIPYDDRAGLRQKLSSYFNEEELRTLCFDMGIDYEDLPGQGKAGKVRELLAYVLRTARTEDLLTRCRNLRPNVPWGATGLADGKKSTNRPA